MVSFFNDTATTEIYTLSLHDALPIWELRSTAAGFLRRRSRRCRPSGPDRKSTRLNSSHGYISYAVFCLKKNCATIIHDQYYHLFGRDGSLTVGEITETWLPRHRNLALFQSFFF